MEIETKIFEMGPKYGRQDPTCVSQDLKQRGTREKGPEYLRQGPKYGRYGQKIIYSGQNIGNTGKNLKKWAKIWEIEGA